MAQTFKILNGPSKFDLVLAVFDNTDFTNPRLVTFTLEWPTSASDTRLQIQSVEREDGSGESWNIVASGYFGDPRVLRYLQIYFSTKHRRGTASFLER